MLIIIACMARNRVIGRNGKLPWRFKADLQHFKKVTTGNTVVMGRTTYEGVGPLPNRTMVVLSRQEEAHHDWRNVLWTPYTEDIVSLSLDRDVFVAGGEMVYKSLLDKAHRIMLTYIHRDVVGDTYFPTFDASAWSVTTARRGNQHSFIDMERT